MMPQAQIIAFGEAEQRRPDHNGRGSEVRLGATYSSLHFSRALTFAFASERSTDR